MIEILKGLGLIPSLFLFIDKQYQSYYIYKKRSRRIIVNKEKTL